MLKDQYKGQIFLPYTEPYFKALYNKVKRNSLVSEDRCYMLYKFCKYSVNLEGDVAELGVYKGGTAFVILQALKDSHEDKQTHLFDTFKGMPKEADYDPCAQYYGQFGDVSLSSVRNFLNVFGNINFYEGYIPDTFQQCTAEKFCFVHIDLDTYIAAKNALNFLYDKLVSGGVFIFDEYGFKNYIKSEKKAVDEFFKDKPEEIVSLGTGQGLVIKV